MEPVIAPPPPKPASAAPAPMLPAESPLEMPVQSLREGRRTDRAFASAPDGMARRRACVIGGSAALTFVAAYQIWWLMRGNGTDVLEAILLLLFVALFAWIAQAFVSALAGFLRLLMRHPARLGLSSQNPLPALATVL